MLPLVVKLVDWGLKASALVGGDQREPESVKISWPLE